MFYGTSHRIRRSFLMQITRLKILEIWVPETSDIFKVCPPWVNPKSVCLMKLAQMVCAHFYML